MKANNNEHEYQAMNVSGVRGGPIMCETRRSSMSAGGVGTPVLDRPRYRVQRGGHRGPPRRDSAAPDTVATAEDSRGRSDDYRPSRRSRPDVQGSGATGHVVSRRGGPRPNTAGDGKSQQDSNLLDYVKVQSKRTRRTNAATAARYSNQIKKR